MHKLTLMIQPIYYCMMMSLLSILYCVPNILVTRSMWNFFSKFTYNVHLFHEFSWNKVTGELTETLNSFHNKNPLQ